MPAPEVAPNTDWRVEADGVAWLTLTRPKQLNAINVRTLTELQAHLAVAAADEKVRCVVLTGQGKTFSAGGDITVMKEMMGDGVTMRERLRAGLERVVLQMWDLEKPIVAAVNGTAFGAGMNLALASDIVIASREAQFQQSFVRVGLVPDTGGTWLLPRLVGLHKAKELAFMGDTLSAEEAHRLGLVNHVVEHEDLLPWTTEYARQLARGPTRALGMAKRAMHRAMEGTLQQALEAEAYAQGLAAMTADHAEGVAAFFEKRAPRFSGK